MSPKVYKSVFRLDFPLAYRMIDRLGEYLELIDKRTAEPPFGDRKGHINTAQHSIQHTANIGEHVFTLNLELTTVNSVIEFKGGSDIDSLAGCPLFGLADELIEKLESGAEFKYNRVGFRSWLLLEGPELKFSPIRDYIWGANEALANALNKQFGNKQDIALVFESKSDDDQYIRLSMGPYQKAEWEKYFSLENSVTEGLILDIDIWQSKIVIPKLKLAEIAKNNQETYRNIVNDIVSELNRRLSDV